MQPSGTATRTTSIDALIARLPQPRRLQDLDPAARQRLLERGGEDLRDVETAVREILDTVRELGDEGVQQLTERFDHVRPHKLVLGPGDFAEALRTIDPALRRTLERAARNLRTVAEATRPTKTTTVEVEPGLRVQELLVPLRRVGCYVPGGKAAYPSSVLMAVVPAVAAGVEAVWVASPPGPDGRPPSIVLAACAVAGAHNLLVAGGAQAVAAFAYGTPSVPAVDKIVGPGNRYVTAAKRLVYGTVDIDSPAGPSEVLILADGSADPEWVARDLIAQAEHAEDSSCILVTTSAKLADATATALRRLTPTTARAATVATALAQEGAILVASSIDNACSFARDHAPEHLQIMAKDPESWAKRVPTAGTTFLGPWAPVPVGDYLTGANHVLPTGGAARWAAQLSVHHFLVRRTWQTLDARAARALAEDLGTFARAEGLPAHAESVEARRRDPKPAEGTA